VYEGTYLSDPLQKAILRDALQKAGLAGPDQDAPAAVHIQHGVNRMGHRVHYYFNYSSNEVQVPYTYEAGADLLTGTKAAHGQKLTIPAWDVVIVEESGGAA
jgi:beta-galactosidase